MENVFDNETVREQKAYDHYKKTEAENFHLKNRETKLMDENKRLRHLVRVYKNKSDNYENKADRRKHKVHTKKGLQTW